MIENAGSRIIKTGLRIDELGARQNLRSVYQSLLAPRFLLRNPKSAFRNSSFSLLILLLAMASSTYAGAQDYTPLSASVRAVLQHSVSDQAAPRLAFGTQANQWLDEMSRRLLKRIPDAESRSDFLNTVHYEAKRAGLEPELLLGLIEVESGFKKYSVSSAGALGYMQVMPFWVKEIGTTEHNLFHLRTNMRYGCTILRHYLDIEGGNLYRALGRYNGSLGRPEYPNLVLAAWHNKWTYQLREADSGQRRADNSRLFPKG